MLFLFQASAGHGHFQADPAWVAGTPSCLPPWRLRLRGRGGRTAQGRRRITGARDLYFPLNSEETDNSAGQDGLRVGLGGLAFLQGHPHRLRRGPSRPDVEGAGQVTLVRNAVFLSLPIHVLRLPFVVGIAQCCVSVLRPSFQSLSFTEAIFLPGHLPLSLQRGAGSFGV